MMKHNHIKQGIIVCLGIFFLMLTIQIVSADTWSVDTESEWNNNEGSSFNDTINDTGLRLNWSSWHNLYYNSSTLYSGTINDLGNIDVSGYDQARFKAEVYDTSSGSDVGKVRFSNSTINYDLESNDYGNWVELYTNISLVDYGSCTMSVLDGGGKNWYIQGRNYSGIGQWNSSWHNWGTSMMINEINFSVNDLGGGITYQVDVSDDGVTVKDSNGWDTIAATGNVLKYPLVDSAQYTRIRFNLTRGSTPLIDGFNITASENATPNIVSTYPIDETQGVSIDITEINVTIHDAEGDTFNWSIETQPNIGSNSSNDDTNGTKNCTVAGLTGGTTYTVFVNVTDSAGNILKYTFDFTTYGSVEFWCFDETDPTHGIPFGLEISNSHYYINYSLNNGDTISISELAFGEHVSFFVNSTGYESRLYTYTISAVSDYNFTFYLPPENDNILRTNSTAVTDPTSDVDVVLYCEPELIVLVQGWNDSTYGHWFTIPNANYSISGNTITINQSMLNDDTTVVQVQYYCDTDVLDYIFHVIDKNGNPINQARIEVHRIYETGLTPVESSLTDGNGDATFSLIPKTNYLLNISKDGFDAQTGLSFKPTEDVRTKTFVLDFLSEVNESYQFYDLIDFNATMYSNQTIKVIFIDSDENTTSAIFQTYEQYNDTASLISTNNTNSDSFTFWVTGVNTSRVHEIQLTLTHTVLGTVTESVFVNPLHTSLHDINNIELIFSNILGNWSTSEGGLGYVNFFFILIPSLGLIAIPGRYHHPGVGVVMAAGYIGFVTSIVFSNVFISAPFIAAIGLVLIAVKGGVMKL